MQHSPTTNSDVKSLFQESELCVVDLTVPYFATVVNDSHLADKVVNLEKLNDLALQVKVVENGLLFAVLFNH